MSALPATSLADLAQRLDAALAPLADPPWREGPVGVAVSGGGDSVALMLAASVWARARGRDLLILSVDHGLRAEAAGEIALVGALCARLGLRHKVCLWRPPADLRVGQASARLARYRLLGDALRQAGGHILLTGHSAGDQAETVLLRAAPHLPPAALAGMRTISPFPVWPEGRGLALVRPFLPIGRERLRQVLRQAGVEWAEDPTNADLRQGRARMRALLAAQPGLRAHALRLLNVSARRRHIEDQDVLRAFRAMSIEPGGIIRLPPAAALAEAPGAGRRVLTEAIAFAAGSERRARGPAVDRILFAHGEHPTRLATAGGALVWPVPGGLSLCRDAGEIGAPVAVRPGAGALWDGRFELLAGIDAPGWTLQAIDPLTPLPQALRQALRRLAPPARASQMGVFDPAGTPASLPALLPNRTWPLRDWIAQRLSDAHLLIRCDMLV